MLALQGVVDVVGGGDVGLAAGKGLGDAEEADEVCAVGVEVLPGGVCVSVWAALFLRMLIWVANVLGVGAVDAHLVLLRGIFSEVFDVA